MAQKPDIHRLYVFKVGPTPRNEVEARARDVTLKTLRFVQKQKPTLKQMGVHLKIIPLTRKDLLDPRVRQGLQRVFRKANGEKTEVSFPALRTPHDSYIGFDKIHDLYESNIKAYRAYQSKGGGGAIADEDDDPLAAYYGEEMTMAGAARDNGHEEESVGEEKDMMSAYRDMMKKRKERRPKKEPKLPGGDAAPKPRRPVAPKRAGTVKEGASDDPLAALDQLEADGADPAGNAADDLMMRSFLENLEESM